MKLAAQTKANVNSNKKFSGKQKWMRATAWLELAAITFSADGGTLCCRLLGVCVCSFVCFIFDLVLSAMMRRIICLLKGNHPNFGAHHQLRVLGNASRIKYIMAFGASTRRLHSPNSWPINSARFCDAMCKPLLFV